MSKQEIYDFLKEIDLCDTCILRYLSTRCDEFENIEQAFANKDIKCVLPSPTQNDGDENGITKKSKPNICAACLGIFQNNFIDELATEIMEKSNLNTYECATLYTGITMPILLLLRELSLWIALIKRFPESIGKEVAPNISIKETFKYLMNQLLCNRTQRQLELNQNGILVNIFLDHPDEDAELSQLSLIKPYTYDVQARKKRAPMTRNLFEKYFTPKNLNIDAFVEHLPVPPRPVSTPINTTKYTIDGPTIFVAGKYRKISRNLSQTPWILDGKRMKDDSLEEIITRELVPFFRSDSDEQGGKVTFMASGREDIDVRCLGKGRPFVIEIVNAYKCQLPTTVADDIEKRVDLSKKVSVRYLQLVKREDLVHIKHGEEHKRKFYRALCVMNVPATVEIMEKLQMPDGFLIQQKTPLRVLHRRPLLTRPRQIYSVTGHLHKENPKLVILDVVTQAGTYVKELVHGEFNRTSPSIASIIGHDIDIIALDVNAIELDWPPEIDNGAAI